MAEFEETQALISAYLQKQEALPVVSSASIVKSKTGKQKTDVVPVHVPPEPVKPAVDIKVYSWIDSAGWILSAILGGTVLSIILLELT